MIAKNSTADINVIALVGNVEGKSGSSSRGIWEKREDNAQLL